MAAPKKDMKKEYWTESLDSITPETRKIFEDYSKIPSDKVIPHILQIRNQAWQITPFPCIGQFHFLDMSISQHPLYNSILSATKTGSKLLDLGCCFGQDIRKLASDGAPSENLVGSDLSPKFLDMGYDLFLDRETLKSKFYAADIFDSESELMKGEKERLDIVHAASVIHLFDLEKQKEVLRVIIQLLKPEAGSLVVGRHVATTLPGEKSATMDPNRKMFWHNDETFVKMWDEVGQEMGGVKFDVKADLKHNKEWIKNTTNPTHDENFRILTFSVKRL